MGNRPAAAVSGKRNAGPLLPSFMLLDRPRVRFVPAEVPQPEIWRCLASGKMALCQKGLAASGIAVRLSVSGSGCHLLFPSSFWRRSRLPVPVLPSLSFDFTVTGYSPGDL